MATVTVSRRYSEDEMIKLDALPIATIELIRMKTSVGKKYAVTDGWAEPSIEQVQYLTKLIGLKRVKSVLLPSAVLEQTKMRGGEVDFQIQDAQVKFAATVPDCGTSEWVIDTIPVEAAVLAEKPSIGRVCFFCACVTKVDKTAVVPLLAVNSVNKFEVAMIDPAGLPILCGVIRDIAKETKVLFKEGETGLHFMDSLYDLFKKCYTASYLLLHSTLLSHVFRLGKQEFVKGAWVMRPSQIYLKSVADMGKQAGSVRPMRLLDKASREEVLKNYGDAFGTMSMIGYWAGDLPPYRAMLSAPRSAGSAVTGVAAFAANHGGKSGPYALLNGRLGVGVMGPTLEKLLEFLIVVWGLSTPHVIIGVDPVKYRLWLESCRLFGVKNMHLFYLPGTVGEGVIRIIPKDAVRVKFDYDMTCAKLLTFKSSDAEEVKNSSLVSLIGPWLTENLSRPGDKWVGTMVLPFGGNEAITYSEEENVVLKGLRVAPLGYSPTARAVFSHELIQLGTAYELGSAKVELPEGVDRVIVDLEPRQHRYRAGRKKVQSLTAQEWGTKVVVDTYRISGYMIAQPRWNYLGAMNLLPPFKQVEILQMGSGDWELIVAPDGDVQFAVDMGQPVTSNRGAVNATVLSDTVQVNPITGQVVMSGAEIEPDEPIDDYGNMQFGNDING